MPQPIDPDAFRSVLGRFASGVTIVTASDGAADHGMTVSAFASLSLDPPLVLVCIDRSAAMHDVLPVVGHFVVNVLAAAQEPLSRRFADLDASQRFDGVGFSRSERGDPVLADVLAWIDCDLVTRHDGGDHGLYVGRVRHVESFDARPLLYYRGGYAQLER